MTQTTPFHGPFPPEVFFMTQAALTFMYTKRCRPFHDGLKALAFTQNGAKRLWPFRAVLNGVVSGPKRRTAHGERLGRWAWATSGLLKLMVVAPRSARGACERGCRSGFCFLFFPGGDRWCFGVQGKPKGQPPIVLCCCVFSCVSFFVWGGGPKVKSVTKKRSYAHAFE